MRMLVSDRGNTTEKFAYITALVWPFFSLILALVNWRSRWSKNIVWVFCGFFGMSFVISNDEMDANRYSGYLEDLHRSDITFIQYWRLINDGELNGRGDYVEPLVRYIVSVFTEDYRILFLIFGLIFGFFFSRNLWFLLNYCKPRIRHFLFPLIILFTFLVPIWEINGFRFWTAAHIFFYAVWQLYFNESSKRAIFFAMLSIFTHVAFIFPSSLLLIFHFLPKRWWMFIALILASFMLINLNLKFFASLLPESSSLPGVNLLKGYLLEEYADNRAKEINRFNWYVRYQNLLLYYYVIIISSLVYFNRQKLCSDKDIRYLFMFGLFIYATTNIINVIPSSGRFYTIAYMFLFASFVIIGQKVNVSKTMQMLYWFSLPCIILPILVKLKVGSEMTGPNLLISNWLYVLLLENKISFT